MIQASTDEPQGPSLHVGQAGDRPLQQDSLQPRPLSVLVLGERIQQEHQVCVVQLRGEMAGVTVRQGGREISPLFPAKISPSGK